MATRKRPASGGRTTPTAQARAIEAKVTRIEAGGRVIDLDDELGGVERPNITVVLFGRDWQLDNGPNVVELASQVEPEDGLSVIDSMRQAVLPFIIPEQREDFLEALAAQPSMTWPRITKITQRLQELVTDRPTTSS